MIKKKNFLFLIISLLGVHFLYAQPANPPAPTTTTYPCGNQTLTAAAPPAGVTYYWGTNCDTLRNLGAASTFTATVTGTYYLKSVDNTTGLWGLGCGSVMATVNPIPSDPPTPTVTTPATCYALKTIKVSAAPAGITYYWQGTNASDTSTSINASSPYTVNNVCGGVTYYVRAMNNTNGCWSNNSTSVTIAIPRAATPCTPPTPTTTINSCNNQTLTTSIPTTGVVFYWQGTSCGTDTSNSASTYTVSTPGTATYYIRAYDSCTNKWSAGCGSVSSTVYTTPCNPLTPIENIPTCGVRYLTAASAPPSGITYYWQGTSCGTDTTLNADSSYAVAYSCSKWTKRRGWRPSPPPTYYIRAYENVSGAWSVGCGSVSIPISNTTPCDPPAPATTNYNCGNQTLTAATPPSGVTYYWQGTSCGTSTASSASSNYTVSTTGTYYLRAYDACSAIWSTNCSSVLSTIHSVSPPPTPAESIPACGRKSLTVTAAPAGITYYWQGITCGTDTTLNASSPYTDLSYSCSKWTKRRGWRPSPPPTYYVRAYDIANSCWSTLCSSLAVAISETTPCDPPTPTTTNYNCGNQTLTAATPPSGVTYYWQGTSCGTSTASSASSNYTVSTTGTYYLRAYDACSAIWSTNCSSVLSTIHSVSPPPTPAESIPACGRKSLTVTAAPAGITYYWQGTTCGTDTTLNASSPYTDLSYSCSRWTKRRGWRPSPPPTYYVRAYEIANSCWSTLCSSLAVAISETTPCDPPTPTTTNFSCGNQLLTADTPSTGVTYYWQGTTCGTSTTSSASSNYTVSTTGTYYLRAYDACSATWSTNCSSVLSTINGVPPPPTPVESVPACGRKSLTIAAAPAGITYYWQGTTCGTDTTLNASSPYTDLSYSCSRWTKRRGWRPSPPPTYYVRAYDKTNDCWSTLCSSIAVAISNVTPCNPPAPTTTNNSCGDQTLTATIPPAGVTYYWQGTTCGTNTASPASSNYTVSTTGKYYLRAYDACSASWSAGCDSVISTINGTPVPPAPVETSPTCGSKTLTIASAPSGVNYYWQGTACGTDMTLNANTPYAVPYSCSKWTPATRRRAGFWTPSAPPTYYVRAYDSINSCWSTLCNSLTVAISNVTPCDPPAPTTNNSCGDQTLTATTPPTGVTYYWQGKTCGMLTGSPASSSYIATTSGTYYLRAYDACINAWSAGCGSVIINIIPRPANPVAAITSNTPACGFTILTATTPPAGMEYFWQGRTCGTDTSYNASSPSTVSYACANTNYYLRTRRISDLCWSLGCDSLKITPPEEIIPCNPPAPVTTTKSCGSQILTAATPPTGISYYWQGTTCDTSKRSAAPTDTVSAAATYYLRAFDNCALTWSAGCDSVTTTYVATPALPPAPSSNTPACGLKTLAVASPPAGMLYYWQGTTCGTDTSMSSTSPYTVSYACTNTSYNLRTLRLSDGCWSATCSATIINPPQVTPCDPPAPVSTTNAVGCQTITKAKSPTGITYYWQGTACDTSKALGFDSVFTAPFSGSYNIRAYDNCSGKWSPGCGAIYTTVVNVTPSNPPTPTTTSNQCGNQTLTVSPYSACETFYWQGTTCGTDTTQFALTYTATATGTYYIRTRNNYTRVWSAGCDSVTTTVTGLSTPIDPPVPSSTNNSCGNQILTAAAPPTCETYYWQGTTCGTDASNSATTYTASVTGTYYLRARNNITSAWSVGCSQVITSVVVSAVPPTPPAPTATTNACGNQILTAATPASCETYFWQGLTCGTSTVDSATTDTVKVSGIYNLRARNKNTLVWSTSCSTVSVTVNNPPVAKIVGNAAICSGTNTTLTASGGTSYLWNNGMASSAITTSPVADSLYKVIVSNGACSDSASVTVKVTTTPAVTISGNTNICSGTSTILTANSSAANAFAWNNGASSASITVSPLADSLYKVVTTNGACSDSASVIVKVIANPTVTINGISDICNGKSTTLTASGGTSYLWNNGETSATITVSPSADSSYKVTVSNGTCPDSAAVTVKVTANPTATINGTANICSGKATTLTASGATNYLWNNGETTAAITVSPSADSAYKVIVSNGTCIDSASITIKVTTTPTAAVNGTSNICSGKATTLTASGGTNYLWNNGESTAAITVSPSADSAYKVIVSNGICSDSAAVTVKVTANPTVAINGTTNICSGKATTLTASGGTDYLWSNGESTATITVSPSADSSYKVTVSNGTCSDSTSITINVTTTPSVTITGKAGICSGESTELTANSVTANSYLWNNGETTTSIKVSPLTDSLYAVTSFNGTCSDSASITINVTITPAITITGKVDICSGESTELTANSVTANSYLWNNGETTTSIKISPLSDSLYAVTSFNGTCSDSASITINVTTTPTVTITGKTDICSGDSTKLTANSVTAASYLWNNGETTESINITPSVDSLFVSVRASTSFFWQNKRIHLPEKRL